MRQLNVAEALVVKDGTGLFNPSGCLKMVHCGFRFIGHESILVTPRADDCGHTIFPGVRVLPATDGSTVDTVKIFDNTARIEMWILASDYAGLLNKCNACCAAKLATPGTFVVTPASTAININWADVPNAATYTVERSTDAGFVNKTLIYTGSVSAYNATGLTNGTLYYFRVRALAPGYQSSAYAVVSGTPA